MASSPRSSSLFHFSKSMDVLQSILKEGFWPRYCLEDTQWQGHAGYEFVAFPMVCFCDIPIGRIAEHVDFYGRFGIGLTKDWGVKNNLNPVIYFSSKNPLHSAVQSLTNIVGGLATHDERESGLVHVRHILAHSKPTTGRMIIGETPVTKDFYQESEWRFVPQHENVIDHLLHNQYLDSAGLVTANSFTFQHCRIPVSPNDIRYIFVPTDADIPSIMNFIQADLDMFPSADLKVLMSRVTSIESLSHDV